MMPNVAALSAGRISRLTRVRTALEQQKLFRCNRLDEPGLEARRKRPEVIQATLAEDPKKVDFFVDGGPKVEAPK